MSLKSFFLSDKGGLHPWFYHRDLRTAALAIPAVADCHDRFMTTLKGCTTAIAQSNVLTLGAVICEVIRNGYPILTLRNGLFANVINIKPQKITPP